jgi:transposase
VHKETSTVTGVCHKQIVKTATGQAEPGKRAASLRRWFPGAPLASAYEAGFSAFVRPRALPTAGSSHIVVNPASLAVAANDKVKTDRRDSQRLAGDLAEGRLRGLYVPTEEEELARLLPRPRAPLVEPRAPLARQIKATLQHFGLIAPASRRLLSHRYLREIESWPLPPALRARLQRVAAQWRLVTRQLIEMRRLLRDQAPAQAALDKGYRSVPGSGEVVARTLATARGAMTRFAHERARCRYTGRTPSASASGAPVRRGAMSRPGSRRVRHLRVAPAWRALSYDAVLPTLLERMAATRGKKRAIGAMARRLIGRMRACFRPGTLYAVGTLASGSRRPWQEAWLARKPFLGGSASRCAASDSHALPRARGGRGGRGGCKRSRRSQVFSHRHEQCADCDFVSLLVAVTLPARLKV